MLWTLSSTSGALIIPFPDLLVCGHLFVNILCDILARKSRHWCTNWARFAHEVHQSSALLSTRGEGTQIAGVCHLQNPKS